MITLIYTVEPEQQTAEIEWLKQMHVYPSFQKYYDWTKGNKLLARFAVIVTPDAALSIKLRHPLQFQADYKHR